MMELEDLRQYCLQKPAVTEELPFDEDTLVFKVKGKMFALTNMNPFERVNLKCDPDHAIELREAYPEVTPGYHMSKKHWNTVSIKGCLSNRLIYQWVDQSYDLVVQGLPKKTQEELKQHTHSSNDKNAL